MKKRILSAVATLFVTLSAFCSPVFDSVWRDDVKTVIMYSASSNPYGTEVPVLAIGNQTRLVLEFDILSAEPESLRWRLVHCDTDWQEDQLDPIEFINGFESGTIDEYTFSFTTLRDYVHYRAVVPGKYAEFIHSGNYAVVVETDDDGAETLLTRRFAVSEQSVGIECSLVRPYDGIELDRRQQVDVAVRGGDNLANGVQMRPEWLRVVVEQNRRSDTRRELQFSGYDGVALAYRNRQCNIFAGGNTFRWFDCSNLRTPMYHVQRIEEYGGEVFAILRPDEDRSRKHFIAETVLRGGVKVNIWDRNDPSVEADYVWVNFSLPMDQPFLDGSVYIVGALTDWRMDEKSRMEYNPQYRAYIKRMLLKQGYYSYQLLVGNSSAPDGRNTLVGSTARLEGDHRETSNGYTVLVYYRSPVDRADRLLSVKVVEN